MVKAINLPKFMNDNDSVKAPNKKVYLERNMPDGSFPDIDFEKHVPLGKMRTYLGGFGYDLYGYTGDNGVVNIHDNGELGQARNGSHDSKSALKVFYSNPVAAVKDSETMTA